MYKRIEKQIVLAGISKRELAIKIGMCYNTLNIKLSGKGSFSLDDAIKIKEVLEEYEPIEMLFLRSA